MQYHRVINIPAGQVSVGDVVLSYRGSRDGDPRVFVGGYGIPVRHHVTECYRDPADGEIYIKTETASQFCNPFDQVHLDCLLTFGNIGNNKKEK